MKKILSLLTILLFIGCAQDEPFIEEVSIDVPEILQIKEVQGLKVESVIVEEEVRINVKLPYSGQYRIKIRNIEGTMVSQEIITANMGDNLLKVYVSTLPASSYKLELTDVEHKVLGVESIVVN
jgi:hypothetical protein